MLPLVELHMHLEGSLEPELAIELAARNGVTLSVAGADELRAKYRFANLQEFLDLYYENLAVLVTVDDFHDLAAAYYRRAAAAGVVHAELFFDPQSHTSRGIALDTVLDGFTSARVEAERDLGITGGLIACLMRDRGAAEATETVRALLPRAADILGIGLDSTEIGNPSRLFGEAFDLAASAGLRRVAHAGEEGTPDYVWEALDVLGVERVDHGNRSLDDPALVTRLVEGRIPLTVCPLSNLALHTAPDDLAEHPLPRMLDLGLVVSVHSDDPAYFGGYIDDNFDALDTSGWMTESMRSRLLGNAIESSFASEARKQELRDALAVALAG